MEHTGNGRRNAFENNLDLDAEESFGLQWLFSEENVIWPPNQNFVGLLLEQTFLGLPVRSLCRFKSICKDWRLMVDDPSFLKEKNKTIERAVGLFIHFMTTDHRDFEVALVPFDDLGYKRVTRKFLTFGTNPPTLSVKTGKPIHSIVSDACNGLALSYSSGCGYTFQLNEWMTIFNPTTRAYRHIKWPPLFEAAHFEAASLVYDPTMSEFFKIVVVSEIPEPDNPGGWQSVRSMVRLDIFNSKLNVWELFCPPDDVTDIIFKRGLYWNGSLYWPSNTISDIGVQLKVDDLEEGLRNFILPQCHNESSYDLIHIGSSRNRIHVIYKVYPESYEGGPIPLEIYEWVDGHWIFFHEITCPVPAYPMCLMVDEMEAFLVGRFGKNLMCYDLKHRTATRLLQEEDGLVYDNRYMGFKHYHDRISFLYTLSLATIAAAAIAVEQEQIPDVLVDDEKSEKKAPNKYLGLDMENYSWSQNIHEVTISVPVSVPTGTKLGFIDCEIKKNHLKVGLKGQPPIIDGELYRPLKVDESFWVLEDQKVAEDQKVVCIFLTKENMMDWWKYLVKGEPEIDYEKMEPEPSISNLDSEIGSAVEKMMYIEEFDQLTEASDEMQ